MMSPSNVIPHVLLNEIQSFEPSSLVADDGATSQSHPLYSLVPAGRIAALSVWKAQVGRYTHQGGTDETFLVLSGTASLEIDGGAPMELTVGSLVHMDPNTPTVLTVTSTLTKFCMHLKES